MPLDIPTLSLVSCLTFLVQSIALFVQFAVNRTDRGVRAWLLGSTLSAIGVSFMPLVSVPALVPLAMIANPLVVSGQIFLYIGVLRFLDQKENRWRLLAILVAFVVPYYYFLFANNSLSARTACLMITLAVILFMTASRLFYSPDRLTSGSAKFNAIVFFAYASFCVLRLILVLVSPPIRSYSDQALVLQLGFLVPLIAGLLWTFGFIVMMNQRLNVEHREETEKLQLIFNTSPDAAVISRLADGSIVDVNAGFLSMSGYTRAEAIGNTSIDIKIWYRAADRARFISELQAKGSCESMTFEFQRRDGQVLTGSISAKVIAIRGVPHIVSVVHDITKSKQAEEALRESEALYRSILNASPDDITITDLKGAILVTSPAAAHMFGYDPVHDPIMGSSVLDYIVPDEREKARANIVSMFGGLYAGPNEYHAVHKDGSTFNIEVNSALIPDANQQPAKIVFVIRNITERKLAEQRIERLLEQLEAEKKAAELNAYTDSLSGLANRRYFDEMIRAEFFRLKRSGAPMSVIMLDVDYFKKYNDRYGHLEGDECLKQIGLTLKKLVRRAADLAARYGGEEFVAILSGTDRQGAMILAETIRAAVEALAIPHGGSDITDHITVSLGIATAYPTQLDSAAQIVALADEALYRSKQGGRNRISAALQTAIHNDPELSPLSAFP